MRYSGQSGHKALLKMYKGRAEKLIDLTDRWYHPLRRYAKTKEEKMRLKHRVRKSAIRWLRENPGNDVT